MVLLEHDEGLWRLKLIENHVEHLLFLLKTFQINFKALVVENNDLSVFLYQTPVVAKEKVKILHFILERLDSLKLFISVYP